MKIENVRAIFLLHAQNTIVSMKEGGEVLFKIVETERVCIPRTQ